MILPTPSKINSFRTEILTYGARGEYLLNCLDQGFWMFPLHRIIFRDGKAACSCGEGSGCRNAGKHTWIQWGKPWDPKSPKTPYDILKLLRFDPTQGIGLHLGLSGLVNLDYDSKPGNREAWDALKAELGITDLQPYTLTASGGAHYLFRAPQNADPRRGWQGPNGETSCLVKLPAIGEWKSGQSLIVLPFSRHKAGGFYERGPGPIYDAVPPALADFVNGQPKFTARPTIFTPLTDRQPTRQARRLNDQERALACVLAMKPAILGQGYDLQTLGVAVALVVGFDLSPAAALPIMTSWNAQRADPPWDERGLLHKLETADKRQGPRGYLLNAEYTPKMSAEEQAAHDTVFTIWWGNTLLQFGPGWTCTPIGTRKPPPAPDIDLAHLDKFLNDMPPKEPEPAAAPAQAGKCFCPRSCKVLMKKIGEAEAAYMTFPCRLWDCPVCHLDKVAHCCDTVAYHLDGLRMRRALHDTRGVFVYNCPADQWETVSRHIRDHLGDFFRWDNTAVGSNPGHSFLIVSTIKPVSLKFRELSPETARDLLCMVIRGVSCTARGKLFSSSRRWNLLNDTVDDEAKYQRVCRLTTGIEQIENVLNERKLPFKYVHGSARWWGWRAVIFSTVGVNFGHLMDELEAGSVLPETVSWGKRQADPPDDDEWAAPPPPADPPEWKMDLASD